MTSGLPVANAALVADFIRIGGDGAGVRGDKSADFVGHLRAFDRIGAAAIALQKRSAQCVSGAHRVGYVDPCAWAIHPVAAVVDRTSFGSLGDANQPNGILFLDMAGECRLVQLLSEQEPGKRHRLCVVRASGSCCGVTNAR